jgi:hypothetical protein
MKPGSHINERKRPAAREDAIDRVPGNFFAGLTVPMTAVPEPSTVARIATGLPLGLGFWCRKRCRLATA